MLRQSVITLAIVHCSLLVVAATVNKRITNGEAAKVGEFPYMVSIQRWDGRHNCGGVLLDGTTVLTAAHCASDSFSMSVRAGTLNQTTGGVHAEVLSRRKHAEYKRISEAGDPFLPNDIAILKLKTPIEKSKTIAYATLPANGSDPAANSTAFIAGWGSTKDMYGGPQALLNKATIPILTREDCSKLDPLAKGNNAIVCAGGVAGQNVCRLDSGGPLVDQKTGEVIGLASWILEEPGQDPKRVTQCGKAPAVFTRVGSYIPFILENLKASKQPENLGKARTL